MASPWKFFNRLISPRRQRKQDDTAIGIEPDVAAISEQTDTPVGENVDQPTRETPAPFIQIEPFSAEPKPPIQTGRDGQDTPQSDSDGGAGTSNPATQGIGATIASAPSRERSGAKAMGKRRGRAEKIATDEGVSQPAEVVPKISDEIILDHEIRMLRIQLTSRLRLQNDQLKKMLERFER
ncbi:hypothetical protein [Pararhizobium sp. DWP1-1-3]|uniref:hypothetical protein n=1 Tax=Pararhizobium sp. DWP1-1-3 TaxID=2804652 RepID=UPI003CF1396B